MPVNKISINDRWKTDIKNWTLITKDTASLIIEQCQLMLKETTETAKLISVKAEKLVSIQLTFATALSVFIFNTEKPKIFLLLTAIASLIAIVISLYFSYKGFREYQISVSGECPKDIVTSRFIDTFKEDQQYLNMLLNVIENIQRRIELNDNANFRRTGYIKSSILSLMCVCFVLFW